MGLLSGDTRSDTAVGWLFVTGQFVLLALILVLPPGDAWPVPHWLDTAGLALGFAGTAVLLVAIVNLGRSLTPLPTPVPYGELRTGGLYRWVRHPIYTGILALAAGWALRSASLAVVAATLALVAWFSVKARWEEVRLAKRYRGYEDYCARTPRFVPGWPGRPAPTGLHLG